MGERSDLDGGSSDDQSVHGERRLLDARLLVAQHEYDVCEYGG